VSWPIPSPGRPSARLLGWRDALTEAGAPVPPVLYADWAPDSGYDAGTRLALDPDVTAVLCGNDELAMGLTKGLADAGKSVPEAVSVIGFDDHPLSHLWTPPLTTVRQDFVRLGQKAFHLLNAQIDSGQVPASVRFVPDLILRSSAAPRAARALDAS
jgi:DNA-binding LacI/PurR family transcriptional regulator